MSLATRCSACGTVFRVVSDQLRVSEGWVRCGRCSQVFNALESLVDLETGLPRQAGLDSGAMALDVAQPAARPGGPPLPADATTARAEPPAVEPALDPAAAQLAREFASTSAPETRPPQASELLNPPAVRPDAADRSQPRAAAAARRPRKNQAAAGTTAPSFVRDADRAARWRRPGVRLALGAVALLASALLAAQVAHTWRDRLAAQQPALAPLLQAGCGLLGCELGPAHVLDALSVESSGLVRVERSNLYRLQVSLRNRAAHDVALPALDLSLTDARGELIARRVLRPAELGESAATIGAGRDLTLQATLQSAASADGAGRVIAGYTVELFYP
jgi:predicted Zn finger-like uncharacterized protein